jgi:mannosyl-3-phosphoglycerate phosphatase family protein
MPPQPIIFTDLDGTLLDHRTYAFTAALAALESVKERKIPLVLCSSKTRAEIEYWREKLENSHPFISENGGGIFIPKSTFPREDIDVVWPRTETISRYSALLLGTPYAALRKALKALRREGFAVQGFGDMTPSQIAEMTGLSLEGATLAKRREFDEPFVFRGDQEELTALLESIQAKGLRSAEGRLYHLMGDNDKGSAVDILSRLYERRFGEIVTMALGDSPVDFPMLEKVDYPVLVRNHTGEHDQRIKLPKLIRVKGIGPEGWNKAVLMLLQEKL